MSRRSRSSQFDGGALEFVADSTDSAAFVGAAAVAGAATAAAAQAAASRVDAILLIRVFVRRACTRQSLHTSNLHLPTQRRTNSKKARYFRKYVIAAGAHHVMPC